MESDEALMAVLAQIGEIAAATVAIKSAVEGVGQRIDDLAARPVPTATPTASGDPLPTQAQAAGIMKTVAALERETRQLLADASAIKDSRFSQCNWRYLAGAAGAGLLVGLLSFYSATATPLWYWNTYSKSLAYCQQQAATNGTTTNCTIAFIPR